MANVTIRNIPDEVHRALRARAAKNNRSTEAEIRYILEKVTMRSGNNIKLGSLLRSIAQEAGEFSSKETEQFNQLRDRTAAEPMRFE